MQPLQVGIHSLHKPSPLSYGSSSTSIYSCVTKSRAQTNFACTFVRFEPIKTNPIRMHSIFSEGAPDQFVNRFSEPFNVMTKGHCALSMQGNKEVDSNLWEPEGFEMM